MGIQNKRYAVVNLSSIAFNVYAKRVFSQIHAGGTTAGGEVIGKIYPNEFYIVIPNESPYITSFRIYFRDKNFQGRYGYIETSKGTTLDDYAWNAHQHPYHYYNSSGDALVESKKSASINGTIYRVFKTACNVSCFSPDKTKHITIPAGMELACSSSTTGQTKIDYMVFYYKKWPSGAWVKLIENVDYAFVDLDIENGSMPGNRAIR